MTAPATVSIRKLARDAPAKDVEAAARVLTEAFRDDHFNWMMAGGMSDLLPLQMSAVCNAAIIGGCIYLAEKEEGAVGAAIWLAPGQELLSDEEQRAAGFNQYMEELGSRYPEMIPWWMDYFLPRHSQFHATSLGEGYKLAAWQLQYIGVIPSKQRQGVGSAMVKHVEDEACRTMSEKKCFCLETQSEANLEFYKTLGYIVKGETSFESEKKLAITAPMWCLRKEID